MNISKLANQVLSLLGELGDWTQHQRVLRLNTPLGPNQLMAESFTGVESLSEDFKFEIIALSGNAHLELSSLIGQAILLELMTANTSTALRPFHGHVTRVEALGSNGGLARYKLIVEPWTSFMALRRDSTTYQDMNVFAILESIFKDYQGQGKLVPSWRLEIADLSVYPKRSLTTQYQESDLAFIQRLMSEEGLFSWIEHLGDPASATLGSHTLVIADHNAAFKPNAQASICFTQPGAVMQSDSMDRWRSERRWQTTAVEVRSWDYRSINNRPVLAHSSAHNSSDSSSLVSQDAPGAYSYETRAHGQRLADQQLQAIEVQNKIFTGAGTVRTLSPGTRFSLQGHAAHDVTDSADDTTFVVLRVVHQAHNNLSADLHAQLEQALGKIDVSQSLGELNKLSGLDNLPASAKDKGERPVYRNRIDAIRSSIPYRSLRRGQHGQLLHPKPTADGQQSAIVVGPAGNVIYTDRDHRIKLQFHWQRGQAAHSRLSHPQAEGHTGAPANEHAGTWVRLATSLAPVAGANWGSHAIPRIGQEVLVDFVEGDIDRPVVVGSAYNGKGNPDGPYNQIASGSGNATGNAPSWFPGETGDNSTGHAHPASLSGIKSQSMGSSQQGTGGYNQLVFDDSPEQSRTSLQQHAVAHQGTAELNLGHLRHQSDNQRLNKTGFGTELKTQHSAALRAGQGMLISSDARANASSSQLDSREAQAQVESSQQLQTSLASTAQKHKAKLKDDKKQDEPEAKKLAAIEQQEHSVTVLKASAEGQAGEHGGKGNVTAYSQAQLQLSSPAGITLTSPKDVILNSGNTSSITAGQDINLASQGNQHHAVKDGISLFTYGKASNKDKANQESGIQLHAASGKWSSQSQSDKTSVTADKSITVTSTSKTVMIAANKHVLMSAMGAFMKLEGSNIMLHGPGKVEFKASMKELAGAGSASAVLPQFPNGSLRLSNFEWHTYAAQYQIVEGEHKVKNQPYILTLPDGTKHFGETDGNGKTVKVGSAEPKDVKLTLLAKEDWEQENVNVWHQEMDKHWE